jgi:hypothetical protein
MLLLQLPCNHIFSISLIFFLPKYQRPTVLSAYGTGQVLHFTFAKIFYQCSKITVRLFMFVKY